MLRQLPLLIAAAFLSLFLTSNNSRAGCVQAPPLFGFDGPGQVVCPCFIEGEEAGVVLDAPLADYPIEIIKVGIGWGSQFGGAPTSLEAAIKFYEAGLPNPGPPVAALGGPQLTDGFINEFDLQATQSTVVMPSGPFSVTLEFLNDNAGNFFAPSVVHDGDGCEDGGNLVFAIPGGWNDACDLGVTGDWVFVVTYLRNCGGTTGVEEVVITSADQARLFTPRPNPMITSTQVEFLLAREEAVDVSVYDVAGRQVAVLANEVRGVGNHLVEWNGKRSNGTRASAGLYFVRLTTPSYTATEKVVIAK